MLWIVIAIIAAAVALSYLSGGGLNVPFIKLVIVFLVGIVCLILFKRLWDEFKGGK